MPTQIDALSPSPGWGEVRNWRKLVRDDLLERRTASSADERRALGEHACTRLVQAIDLQAYTYSVCGGRFAANSMCGASRSNIWPPAARWRSPSLNIPIPKERDVLMPDAVIVPLVGFDESGFRLGYGGGYFDRTLAAAPLRPYAIGLGYEDSALQTIHPQRYSNGRDCDGAVCLSSNSEFVTTFRGTVMGFWRGPCAPLQRVALPPGQTKGKRAIRAGRGSTQH